MTFACSSNTFDSKKKKKWEKKKKEGSNEETPSILANYDANYNVVNCVSTPWIFYSFMIPH